MNAFHHAAMWLAIAVCAFYFAGAIPRPPGRTTAYTVQEPAMPIIGLRGRYA